MLSQMPPPLRNQTPEESHRGTGIYVVLIEQICLRPVQMFSLPSLSCPSRDIFLEKLALACPKSLVVVAARGFMVPPRQHNVMYPHDSSLVADILLSLSRSTEDTVAVELGVTHVGTLTAPDPHWVYCGCQATRRPQSAMWRFLWWSEVGCDAHGVGINTTSRGRRRVATSFCIYTAF